MMHLARRTIGGWEEFKGLPYSPYLPPPYFPNSQKVSYLLEKELMTMLGLELERVGRVVGGGEGGKSRAQRWERRHQRGCTAPPPPLLLLLRPKPALLWLLAARPPPTGSDPQSSLGGRTGEMPAPQAVTQEPRDICEARTRSD